MTENARAASSSYIPSLDGLRGVGIFAMLLYHGNVGVVSGAFLAISMFFTLSGYLIGGQLHAEFERSGRIDLIAFYERRMRRLMPGALLGLGAAMLYAVFLAPLGDVRRIAGDVIAALFYVPNWRFVVTGQSYDAIFSNPSPVQHYWSLGVEEQFYIFLPLLFWLVLSRGSKKALTGAVLGITLLSCFVMYWVRVPNTPLGHAYYGTDARVAEVLIGVLFALWFPSGFAVERPGAKRAADALAIVVLAASAVLWLTTHETNLWFYRGGAPLYSLGTLITISACLRDGPVRRLFSPKPLVYVGRISYGLYVYHWPIYLAVEALDPGWSTGVVLALQIGVTFAVAMASHRFIEQPIRKREWFTGPRRAYAPPISLAIFAGSAVAILSAAPSAVSDSEVRLEAKPHARVTSGGGPPSILVAGDSMSENIGKGLYHWGLNSGAAAFGVHSVPACGLALEGERGLASGIHDSTALMCEAMQRHWAGGLFLKKYDAVALLIGTMDFLDRRIDGWSDYRSPGDPVFDDWFVSVYRDATQVLLEQGVDVVFLTYPCSGSPQTIRERKQMDNVEMLIQAAAYDIERIRYYNEVLLPRVVEGRSERVKVVDLFNEVCPGGAYQASYGSHERARLDSIHFTEGVGTEIADWLGPQILGALGYETGGVAKNAGVAAQ